MTAATSPEITKNISVPAVWIGTSVLVSVLVTITSLFGIVLEKTYSRETHAWAIQAIGQDYANLAVVIILLVSTYFVSKHSLRGFLVWLGAYLYLIYAFAIYAFAVHFQFLFLAYVLILGLSFYTLVGGMITVDMDKFSRLLLGNPKAKIVSVLLFIIGAMFSLLWLSEIVPNLIAGTISQGLVETQLWVNPVHVLDLAFLLPGMIIISVLLWKEKVLGCVMAVPLLVFAATMGLGIIAVFAISAIKGLPYSLPAGIMIGIIIVLSSGFSYMFLKEVKED